MGTLPGEKEVSNKGFHVPSFENKLFKYKAWQMENYFNVLYCGKSYSLQAKWHKLNRGEIEYAIDMFHSGHFETLTEALEWIESE